MGTEKYILVFTSIAALLYDVNGCQIDGISNWLFTVEDSIYDYHEGIFWNRAATNIAEITNFSSGGGVNSGRYIAAALQNGNVTLMTSAEYAQYEENEVSATMSFTLTFRCTDGTTNLLTYEISVIDTNNNDPEFLPNNIYEFTVLPPLPPGFEITGCGNDIIVRDIDLTTSSIIFTIEENPYVEVMYDGRSPTEYKQFLASLRTKDLIRSLPEDLELRISATDVDATGDPPRTTSATIKLKADEDFQFPEEPIFSQPLYLATYADEQVVMQTVISLRQGFDDEVVFSLDEDQPSDPNLSNYFELVAAGNEVSISADSLPDEVVRRGQAILVIRATREYTSGDTATIIVTFPEVPVLEFDEAQYSGRIVDNTLQPLQLHLKEGYEREFNVSILGEYSSFFSTTIQGNAITLVMTALDAPVLDENSFLSLQVVASNVHSSTTAVVILEIVKDDNVTPLFEKPIYVGEYKAETGLTLQQITLVQGYDNTVSFNLDGDYAQYFQLTNDGASVTVTSLTIPVETWAEQHITLILSASKPRTVGSSTILYINLPPARVLLFAAPVYSGTLRDTTVDLSTISLSEGDGDDVRFVLVGEYSGYFSLSITQNQVSVNLPTSLPDDVISQNSILVLTLRAFGTHALTTETTLLLEIIKEDITTPVFTENVYRGTYENSLIELESLSLMQGYDNSVTFRLQGEYSQYFRVHNNDNNVTLEMESEVPEDVIFSEKVLVFSVLADKPLTVGANAAIAITFSEELTSAAVMGFSQNTYVGYLENNELNMDVILLQEGYEEPTEFTLTGEYSSYFSLNNTGNVINISLTNELSEEIKSNNKFIILEITAKRDRAVPVTASIIIDLIVKEIVTPVFSKPYYLGVYSNGTLEEKVISLSQGYDDTVSYALDGEYSVWFKLTQSGNDIILSLDSSNTPIPDDILENNNYILFSILAHKPGTTTARAAVFIDIAKEVPDPVIVRFTQNSYVGRIENEELFAPTVTLLGEREPIDFVVTGDYAQYFEVTQTTPTNVQIQLRNGLPENIDEVALIILDIEAQYPGAISGHTSVVLEVIQQPLVITPVFEHAYYTGEFSEQELQFDPTIRLIQGFDESVVFTLAGDEAQFFELVQIENNTLTLALKDGLNQISGGSHLTFSVVANKANSVPGNAAIIITLPEYSSPLRFSRNVYKGYIANGSLEVENFVLEEGYSPDLSINFAGDYVTFFQLNNQEETFTLQTSSEIPAEILESNNVLVFTIEAQVGSSRTHAAIILEIIKSEVSSLAFEEAYYVGSYSVKGTFTFDPQITLIGGYDETVSFSLKGEHAQWFDISQYPVLLTLNNAIPNEIISNSQQLIFVIAGEKPGYVTARSTIVVTIVDDTPILEFDRNIYLGTVEDKEAKIDTVVLSTGYSEEVSFNLAGDLANYFTINENGSAVTVSLQTVIPEDQIPSNGLILLELQASAPQATSTFATLIFSILDQQSEWPQFSETFYTGSYSQENGFEFLQNMTLTEGFDDNVQFTLKGDDSQYFEAIVYGNSVSLTLIATIPGEIVLNRHQLIFTIEANKANVLLTRAPIIISLITDSDTEFSVLRFDKTTYMGSIEEDNSNLDPIILREGYNANVSFDLIGDLSNYFILSNSDETVTITLRESIPEDVVPDNGIIILELQASSPNAVSALATVVLYVVRDSQLVSHPIFSEAYYIGRYSKVDGLTFPDTIYLSEGFDETVEFSLHGEYVQYFNLEVLRENEISLRIDSLIPDEFLINNNQLILIVHAVKPDALTARATVVISVTRQEIDFTILQFERTSYLGSIQNNSSNLDNIALSEGYSQEVTFTLLGDLADFFILILYEDGTITVTLQSSINEEIIPDDGIIILELRASAPQAISTSTTIIFNVVQKDLVFNNLIFAEPYYTGKYNEEEGLIFESTITIIEGYDETVTFSLEGSDTQYFRITGEGNALSLELINTLPPAILLNSTNLIFTIKATKPNDIETKATIIISVINDKNEHRALSFDQLSYLGSIENGTITHLQLIALTDDIQDISLTLFGDLASYFGVSLERQIVTISLHSSIPEDLIPDNRIIILELQASSPQYLPASASVILLVRQDELPILESLVFDATYYTGYYTEVEGLIFEEKISLSEGYDPSVEFILEGDDAQYFEITESDNLVTLRLKTGIPPAVVSSNQHLIFTIRAEKPSAVSERATIIISLEDDRTEGMLVLGFSRISYIGSIENNTVNIDPIILSEGYSEAVTFTLLGDLASYFAMTAIESVITISLSDPIPEELINSNRIIVLELQAAAPQATSSYATLVFEIMQEEYLEEMVFSSLFYTGEYIRDNGTLDMPETMRLALGYDETVQFSLQGDQSMWFQIVTSGNSAILLLNNSIPDDILENNRKIIFFIFAEKHKRTASAVIVISIISDATSLDVSFEKVLYEGIVEDGAVTHETIIVNGHGGSEIAIFGEFSELFSAIYSNREITVQGVGSVTLPATTTYVALELRAGGASAVLLLNIIQNGSSVPPTVTFTSPSYTLRVDVTHTGLVGRVEATADNGEDVIYSLDLDDAHLLQRISISSNGEMHLSAPANSGVYNFHVVATTVLSRANGTASVHLSVETITTCGEESYVLPPLQILDRDEESPHTLITFNKEEFPDCRYTISNRWPIDQQWLYVDENGLHTRSIDREHTSIAFMALSQIQVELTLECEKDSSSFRNKRSVETSARIDQLDHLGPYDYGPLKWILTDSILHNSRKSLVNLIVNDINDNYPIFAGEENKPVTVGWPVADLEERIVPRYLVEVKAADADVGENAALVYWSDEDVVAVSPTTGLVHVRANSLLRDNSVFTVYATDRNGAGLTGSIEIMVKLIDTSHIAVVTVRNAFLNDEENILSNLSAAVGYEVKALRATVVTDTESDETNLRNKREAIISTGASVQLYVYGLIDVEPVEVIRLTEDINSIQGNIETVVIASTVSLEDHLETLEICSLSGRDTGLLVSTIVLAVLLFILIAVAAVWIFLKWRKKQNYEQFSDTNSLTSRDESHKPAPNLESAPTKHRINIEELKKSERRLQEMLDAPVTEIMVKPTTSKTVPDKVTEAKVNLPEPPLVIQSIDKLKDVDDDSDDDEFGEIKKARRKSVVTFNENVEKIIHVEDLQNDPDDFEVYRL